MNKLSGLLLLFFFFSISLSAQNQKINGRVTDTSGVPLNGASIIARSTKKGVKTDATGNFSITVPNAGPVNLIISAIGYKPKTVTINGSENLSVQLIQDIVTQEEVVINVGYGTLKKKEVSSSVSSITAKDLKDVPINSAAEALNGRLAGVTATTAEGAPDAEVRVRVRNGISISGDNSPLYIVDGVQVENALSTLSPQDIQSIDVLKDASASAIYGARGANGVIIISTKSGKPGKLKLSYNGFVGIKYLPNTLDVLSPYDFVIYQSERSRGNSTDSTNFANNFGTYCDTLSNYKNANPINWQKEMLGKIGITQTHNVSANGGNKFVTYNFGYTFNNEKSIVINSKFVRHLVSAKADYKITKKIKVGAGFRYTNQNVYGAGVSDDKTSLSRLRNAVKYRPFLSNGQTITEEDPYADPNPGNSLGLVNPIILAHSEFRRKTTDQYNITATASWNFFKNFSFKSTFGYDNKSFINRQFSDSNSSYGKNFGSGRPTIWLDTTKVTSITNSNVLSYSLKNFKGKHDFDFLVGEETYDLRTEVNHTNVGLFPTFISHDDAFNNNGLGTNLTGFPAPVAKTRYTSVSFFSRINYSLLKRYILSFNVRADGASKFAPENRWGYFPAGSIAWKIKDEKFMDKINFINDFKIRAGYGSVGNNRIGDYLYIPTFFNDNRYYYGVNNQAIYAYYPGSLPNANLVWESSVTKNLGIDLSLFRRIDISVDIYKVASSHLLLNIPIASTFGYSSQVQNVGKTSNRGVELQLSALILKKKNNLTWNASFNMSFNRNRVEEVGRKNQNYFKPPASWGVNGPPADYIERVGDPVGSYWGLVTDGFYNVNDFNYNNGIYTLKPGVISNSSIIGPVQPGSIKFKDLNGDGIVDVSNDLTIIGNPTPKFTGGLNQSFTYKQWDASIFVNFSYGNDIYNANKIEFTNAYNINGNLLTVMQNRWKVITATGQTAQWINGSTVYGIPPDQLAALNAGATIWQPIKGAGAFYSHSWAIEDGSFLRFNNITIGYTLPVRTLASLGMSKLRFYVTGNNLAILTSYTGYDPEVSVKTSPLTPGLDYSAYPKSRSFVFGVNATF